MALLDQWPQSMQANPNTVEVALHGEVLVFDARTRSPRPGRSFDPVTGLGLADGAQLEARVTTFAGLPGPLTYRFTWRDHQVENVRSAARVGGDWYVADPDGVLAVATGERLPMTGVRLLATGGPDLVVLREGEVSRWSGATQRCALPVRGMEVTSVVAGPDATLLVTREGALALDRDCHAVGAAASRNTTWSFDGARLWAWAAGGLHRVELPDFRIVEESTAKTGWIVGDRVITQEDDHLNVTSALGAVEQQIDGVGLESLTAVAASGDHIAVTDGRVVALVGGERWVRDGLVLGIRAVGPQGVVIEERGPGLYEHPRLVVLGESPGPMPTDIGTPTSGMRTAEDWTVPAAEAVDPSPWFLGRPVGTMACTPVKAEVDGVVKPWSFARPTLVAVALPRFLPYGADALSPAMPPPVDDLHTVGRAEHLALHNACGRWLGDEAWIVQRGVATAWKTVELAVRALEAQEEGWMDTPREMPAASWRVPAGGSLSAATRGVIVASPNGSVAVGESGPYVRAPGWLMERDQRWVSHVGPWSLVFDETGTEIEEAVVGQVVEVDPRGAVRRDGAGLARVERHGDRTQLVWGPALASDAVVSGWSCARNLETGGFGGCRQVDTPERFDQRVGDATWSFDDGRLTMRRGRKVVLQRDGVDDVIQAGSTLLVRAYAHDRPWVRYDDNGQALSVLAPGDAVAQGGSVWLYDEDLVSWFDG